MGNTTSLTDVSNVLQSLEAPDAPAVETVDSLFNYPLTEIELEQVLPLEALRKLRHYHTRSFALVLYRCMHEMSLMLGRKRTANPAEGSAAAAAAPSMERSAVSRFLAALLLLRRMMPVALESGSSGSAATAAAARRNTRQSSATTDQVAHEGDGSTTTTNTQQSEPVSPPVFSTSSSTSLDAGQVSQQPQPQPQHQESPTATPPATTAHHDPTPAEDGTLPLLPPPPTAATAAEGGTSISGAAAATTTQPPLQRTAATRHFVRLFFVEGKTCDDANPSETFPLFELQQHEQDEATTAGGDRAACTFASYLVNMLVECCFIRGLTLPANTVLPPQTQTSYSLVHPEVITCLLWAPGLGHDDPFHASASAPRVSTELYAVRSALVQTLLSVLSTPLYHSLGSRDVLFMESLISVSRVPLMPTLAVSLLNTIMAYKPYGVLPYTSHVVGDEEQTVVSGARLLCATLCYTGIPLESNNAAKRNSPSRGLGHIKPPGSAVLSPVAQTCVMPLTAVTEHLSLNSSGEVPSTQPPPSSQQRRSPSQPSPQPPQPQPQLRFVHCVRKTIHEIAITEAKYMLEQLYAIMSLRSYSGQTLFPDSQRRFASQDEFMLLLWKLMELSPSMYMQCSTNPRILKYLVPIMEYAMDVRVNARFVDHVQVSLYMLTRLSESRSFCLLGNEPFSEFVPFSFPKLPAGSNFHDFLVICMCYLMEIKDPAFSTYHVSSSMIVANIAPYVAVLGRTASTRLVAAFSQAAHRCLRGPASASPEPVMHAPIVELAAAHHQHQQQQQAQSRALMNSHHVMLNTCEAMASMLQYHEAGSRCILVSLVGHKGLIHRVRDAYAGGTGGARTIDVPHMAPFRINVLDAAVTAALPFSSEFTRQDGHNNNNNTNATSSGSSSSSPLQDEGDSMYRAALQRLQALSLVGVLPTPHPIATRKMQSSKASEQWALLAFWTHMYLVSRLGWMGDNHSIRLLQFVT